MLSPGESLYMARQILLFPFHRWKRIKGMPGLLQVHTVGKWQLGFIPMSGWLQIQCSLCPILYVFAVDLKAVDNKHAASILPSISGSPPSLCTTSSMYKAHPGLPVLTHASLLSCLPSVPGNMGTNQFVNAWTGAGLRNCQCIFVKSLGTWKAAPACFKEVGTPNRDK